ncbi:hypothetical protein ACIPYS_22255 [Kitasatospora sp. NPDC089913]|uniref:hypothetical protein n=1 Tax=Kitasatospora sp. NPDC089913 TaxID=3364080 RepID=UPI00380409D9
MSRSMLWPFFTGVRLINEGSLNRLVVHLDGDVARAERLRKKAAAEWDDRPDPAPVGPAERAQAPNRPLHLFKAGCAVGDATTLQQDAPDRFEEFLGSLRILGLDDAEVEPLHEIRAGLEEARSVAAGRAVMVAYGGLLPEVIGLVEERSTGEEFRWFRLGKLLQSIALVASLAWPEDPDIDDERTELFYLSDMIDMPEGLRAHLKSYCRLRLPATERMELLGEAYRLKRAVCAIL